MHVYLTFTYKFMNSALQERKEESNLSPLKKSQFHINGEV